MNIKKPTKWFINLATKQKNMDSPTSKLKKNGSKYNGTEDVLKDTKEFFSKFLVKEPDQLESQLNHS